MKHGMFIKLKHRMEVMKGAVCHRRSQQNVKAATQRTWKGAWPPQWHVHMVNRPRTSDVRLSCSCSNVLKTDITALWGTLFAVRLKFFGYREADSPTNCFTCCIYSACCEMFTRVLTLISCRIQTHTERHQDCQDVTRLFSFTHWPTLDCQLNNAIYIKH